MPQEFAALQCYSCHIFQVDIVKKIPKWTCKLCGEKQSVKKVYHRGTGKDCRLYVQELNEKLSKKEVEAWEELDLIANGENDIENIDIAAIPETVRISETVIQSKWDEFVVESDSNESFQDIAKNSLTEVTDKRRREMHENDNLHSKIKTENNTNNEYISKCKWSCEKLESAVYKQVENEDYKCKVAPGSIFETPYSDSIFEL